jgi:type III pantothenate kinase
MILVIDAGNTWLKWACLRDGQLGPVTTRVHYGVNPSEWQNELAKITARPARVVVASVAGPALSLRLTEWVRQHWQLTPEYPRAQRSFLGVVNSYQQPEMLSIERWLALLAAWRAVQGPLVTICAGTALTIDLLDADGGHLGGYSIPGSRLMREALHGQTRGIAAAALLDTAATAGVLGINTAGCVQQGARLALAAFADRHVRSFAAASKVSPRVFVTGGAAPQVGQLMRSTHEQAPDLVLRGLCLLLEET